MLNDDELLAAAKQLQLQALTEIYDRYQAMIYAYAYRSLLNPDIAEDCTAATFERLLMALQHGKGPRHHLKAYLYRIAHNWMVDWQRRENRQIPVDFQAGAWPASDPAPHDVAVGRINAASLRAHLQSLTLLQREVLLLRFFEDFSLREVARLIHKPVGAVKSIQNRGLAALRRRMEESETTDNDHEKKS